MNEFLKEESASGTGKHIDGIATLMGWPSWQVGVPKREIDKAKRDIKEKKAREKKFKAKIKKLNKAKK